jgi:phosphoenolpyruvate-protein phosphotransferase
VELSGIAAAPGVAIGPIWRHAAGTGGGRPVLDVQAAAAQASSELMALAARLRAGGRPSDAEILEAQAMMALDPMLLDAIAERVNAERTGLDPASSTAHAPDQLAALIEIVAGEQAATIAALEDELLAARAADVRDVGARVARIVAGRTIDLPDVPSIAIAEDLPPSVAAEIDDGKLLGIALERGSATSHAAILARGLGIPAVVGARGLLAAADEQAMAAVDGDAGRVIFDPTEDDLRALRAVVEQRHAAGAAARALRGRPGRTADGHRVELLANIGRTEEVDRAVEAGAEGIGLFRTEFLFVGRAAAPSEDEQADAYRRVLEAFGERPVVIRLLDVGGDKPLPYLRLAPEPNPFLGIRGLRLAHKHREVLLEQLRAIARAGAGMPVAPRVMAPMVTTIEDVELLHELVAAALANLDRRGVARAARLQVGIMIEVPSAVFLAAELAQRVDFFSIGSNDLTQYVLAMDRTHPELAPSADALHPAVLRAIRATVDGAAASGIEVAVCGELGGDPVGALVLAGFGIQELSMDPGRLDAVRLALSRLTLVQLQDIARPALAATTADEVRSIVRARTDQAG